MSELIIFEHDKQPVEVRLDGETVWLTQRQMGELFGTTPENVLMHLRNIFGDEELLEAATTKDFLAVRQEGKRQVKRRLKHYNLDAIISVGYRVNSTRATRFRQWATRVLREQLTQGYSLNEHRLAQQGMAELEQATALLSQTLERHELVTDIGREAVGIIMGYARTWRLLLDYDEGNVQAPAGQRDPREGLSVIEARKALDALSDELKSRREASELFARDRGDNLAGILGNIEQTMFGDPLYASAEERAAHLLYFLIKNHPFSDGNKRSGAFLLLLYLRKQGLELTLNEQGLTALTLLIAESDPKAKDLMVRLTMNLLSGHSPGLHMQLDQP
ncbi:MAG: virulence RhuM family protein [Sinobacteraceae bacterium]|nr:virulence RhuM family protein [Nevskiaceae bacterium]